MLEPMRLYLCRHAHAAAGEPDELRPLTPAGFEAARTLGSALAASAPPPALVLSSPLLRARQTAEEISDAAGCPILVDDRLAPGATAEALLAAIGDAAEAFDEQSDGAVATVGHQPDCSEIALALTGRDPGFPAAGVVAVDLAGTR
jgi:phosphohistidine phosphatase